MAKDNIKETKVFNAKVAIFWSLILALTTLFAVLFVMRFLETRILDSYEDIEKADLNLAYDIMSEEGDYYVYIYSAKENIEGDLVDTAKSDINKANEVFPTVLYYFNWVRRNERILGDDSSFMRIYGYNVKNNEKDTNLKKIAEKYGVTVSQLPVLVKVNGTSGSLDNAFIKTSDIQKELEGKFTK